MAVLLTLLMIGLGTGGVIYFGYPPLSQEVANLTSSVPEGLSKLKSWAQQIGKKEGVQQLEKEVPHSNENKPNDWVEAVLTQTGKITLGLTSVLSIMVIVFVLGAFFAHEPDRYFEGLLLLTPRKYEEDLRELWRRLAVGLNHWMKGILLSMTIMGVVGGIALGVAGIKDWALLGVVIFFGTFVPYLGALASSFPGLILGLSESFSKFLAAGAAYLVVHIVEGYIVEPLIMRRAVVIRPAILLLWQLMMGMWAGVFGIVIGTPLLVCVKVIVNYVYVEKTLHKNAPAV